MKRKLKPKWLLALLVLLTPLGLKMTLPTQPKVLEPELTLSTLEPLNLSFHYNEEDKIVAELMAQQIFTQKCSDSPLCEFVPKKEMSVLEYRPFNYQKIKSYQGLSYEENAQLLKKQSGNKLIENYESFIVGDCPRNTSAAWMKKNESELRTNHLDKLQKMYEFVSECTKEPEHEELHLRQALFNYYLGKLPEAQESIKRALLVANNERMRILYWAGVLLQNQGFLEQVVNEYPYTFHAIESSHRLQKNLFSQIIQRPNYTYLASETIFVEIVKQLIAFEQYDALDKLLRLNVRNKNISNQEWFYINRMVKYHLPSQYGIWLVARLSQSRPDYLNNQVLQLVYEKPYFDDFSKNAELFKLDPYLLLSLSKQESGFNNKAHSRAKARGLMQLLPSTAKTVRRVSADDLYDPATNIELGTKYFYGLYDKYHSIESALAAYNAGPGAVDRWLKLYPQANQLLFMDLIPYKETRSYVGLILRNHYYYTNLQKILDKAKKVEEK